MIVVLKVVSGEEVIGRMTCEDEEAFEKLKMYEVFDPMWIVPGDEGAMKLRDALMLAENISLIFNPGDVITCYKPSKSLSRHYERANEYSQTITRANINYQIDTATRELDAMMKAEEAEISSLTNMILKMTGSKLH